MHRYIVNLTPQQRAFLESLLPTSNKHQTIVAQVLLQVDTSQSQRQLDKDIARSLGIGHRTVLRIKKRCVERGMEWALARANGQRIHSLNPARIAYAQQMYTSGRPVNEICEELNISRATMYRWFRDAAKDAKDANAKKVDPLGASPAHAGDVRRVQKRHQVIESYG